MRFATESHILGVSISEGTSLDSENVGVKTLCRSLPRDSAKLTCAGYSHWEEKEHEQINAKRSELAEIPSESIKDTNDTSGGSEISATVVHRIEALALIDPDLIEEHDFQDYETPITAMNLHRPPSVVIEKDDTASMVTPTLDARSVSHSKQTHPHHRAPSSSSILSGTTATSNMQPLSGGSFHRKTHSELSKGSNTTISDAQQSNQNNNNAIESDNDKSKQNQSRMLEKSKARLVLRQEQYTLRRSSSNSNLEIDDEMDDDGTGNSNVWSYERRWHESSYALLDFRPLCPCLARWKQEQFPGSNNNNSDSKNIPGATTNTFVGIWLGSADDATLRLYVPSSNDPRALVSVALPQEHFSVDSPVMALDFRSVSWEGHSDTRKSKTENLALPEPAPLTTHTLAVACQDGTIRLITWRDRSMGDGTIKSNYYGHFGEIWSQKVIVDGPLVCIKLDYNHFASFRVIVGSLCGYVCQLTYDNRCSGSESSWEGPFMIVQDLFNSSINTEESVLAVDVFDNYVVIGTQLGRCLLYATYDSENYFPVWQTVLPYPIHGTKIISRKGERPSVASCEEGELSEALSVAVITRRSFHLFDAVRGGIPWRRKPTKEHYSPELAKIRLSKILDEIQNENKESDLATRKSVLETIRHLVHKVEMTAQTHKDDIEKDSSSILRAHVLSFAPSDKEDSADHIQQPAIVDSAQPRSSTFDSCNQSINEEGKPADPPHWEYSSSDEDAPPEPDRSGADSEDVPSTPTERIEQNVVDKD
ncbi:unnamed protein product [Pseudo-nitzschia multistriata]|uniref:Uncharacterized protein n=1 Tax=Pseudo-nitzschia multistriata TaxID=183589 RepID=A0A448Z9P7_9STRA|nr:unnamed protein product [Pseudo-nitzschia multistriata]